MSQDYVGKYKKDRVEMARYLGIVECKLGPLTPPVGGSISFSHIRPIIEP